jgi:hypothetical protein
VDHKGTTHNFVECDIRNHFCGAHSLLVCNDVPEISPVPVFAERTAVRCTVRIVMIAGGRTSFAQIPASVDVQAVQAWRQPRKCAHSSAVGSKFRQIDSASHNQTVFFVYNAYSTFHLLCGYQECDYRGDNDTAYKEWDVELGHGFILKFWQEFFCHVLFWSKVQSSIFVGGAFENAIFDFEDFGEEKSSPRKTKLWDPKHYVRGKKL